MTESLNLFKGYRDTEPTATTLSEVVRLIREDTTVKEQTEKFRYFNTLASPDKRECERVKSGTPCFAVAEDISSHMGRKPHREQFERIGRIGIETMRSILHYGQ